MDTLSAWHFLQFASGVATLLIVVLFAYDAIIAQASKRKLVVEFAIFLMLSIFTLVFGIRPPAPPPTLYGSSSTSQ